MAVEFKTEAGTTIAILSGALDNARGEEFASRITGEIPKGGRLVVDGSELHSLTQQGVLHLMTVQRWASSTERKRLLLVGFNATIWRAIVENGSDFFFDSKSTLAEAMQSLDATAGVAPVAPTNSVRSAVPVKPAVSPLFPAAESALISAPRPVPVVAKLKPADDDGWLKSNPPGGAPPPAPFQEPTPLPAATSISPPYQSPYVPARPEPSGHRALWIALAAIAVFLGGIVALWSLLANRTPVLTVSASSTTVEEDGKEADDITAQVSHGRLVEKSYENLPKGLYFEAPADDSGTRTYTLRGKAEPGAVTSTVQLEATNDGGQRSQSVPFTVNVKPKPMTWQLGTLRSLNLKEGTRIWTTSKFVANADHAAARSELPRGLSVEAVPGKSKDWQLVGTPRVAGNFPVVFTATSPTGHREEQDFTLVITPENTPPSLPGPHDDVRPTPPPAPNIDDGMRRFLLDRIENLPSRYTDQERENLRAVVGTLRQARLIYRVVFEREGQTSLSTEQAGKLREAVQAPDNGALLKDEACQIVVVGYASRTGSIASNVRVSKQRARAVNDALHSVVGHNADLCGDYGPTDVVDQTTDATNRAVEVYAGTLEPSSEMQGNAERFKRDFNQRHGIH